MTRFSARHAGPGLRLPAGLKKACEKRFVSGGAGTGLGFAFRQGLEDAGGQQGTGESRP